MARRWPVLLVPLALAGVLAAGSAATAPPRGSGITGLVFIGPVCGMERIRPQPSCRDRPHVATIDFRVAITNRFVRSARSDVHGRFVAHLAPGVYVVAPRPGPGIARPLRPRRVVTVSARRFTAIRVDYDSGIRFTARGLR
jgi:hypothetical protein